MNVYYSSLFLKINNKSLFPKFKKKKKTLTSGNFGNILIINIVDKFILKFFSIIFFNETNIYIYFDTPWDTDESNLFFINFFFLFLQNRVRLFAPNARRKIYGWRFFARPLCHRNSAGRALSRLSIRHSVIFGDERKSKALRRRTVTPERVVIAEKTRGGQGRRGGRRAIRPGFFEGWWTERSCCSTRNEV